jgi:hypothetical protein|tara:strand:- start:523 stop:831 length:309 start_codon:yes stop_codon:yes gene_type:complete
MVKRIKVKDQEEFELMLQNKDIKISKAIVFTAIKHLHSKKRFIPVLEVHLEDLGDIFDITLDKKDIIQTLKQNLEIHEYHEEYEGCALIASAIKEVELKNKK